MSGPLVSRAEEQEKSNAATRFGARQAVPSRLSGQRARTADTPRKENNMRLETTKKVRELAREIDTLVTKALATEEGPKPEPRPRHNHLTRDLKPAGDCPACDLAWDRHLKAEARNRRCTA